MRASPFPVHPDPHLPEGCDVGDLHNKTVLLASLKPGGMERLRRFPAALRHRRLSIPCPCCNSRLANSLKLKVYECTLLDLSFPVLRSPATVFLARHLSADLTGIPPPLENQAHTRHLEPFQAACSIHYLFVTRTIQTKSGFCTSPSSWHLPTCLPLSPSQLEGKAILLNLLSLRCSA